MAKRHNMFSLLIDVTHLFAVLVISHFGFEDMLLVD